MTDGFEYGIRYPDTPPGDALGPFPTLTMLGRWLTERKDRILARRRAGSNDPWEEVPK